jgi:hypothetical protein
MEERKKVNTNLILPRPTDASLVSVRLKTHMIKGGDREA